MPLTDAELANLGDTLETRLVFMSLHNGNPGTNGANEISGGGYARQACTFTSDGDGDLTLDAESFTATASQAVTHVGFWSASSGGTFRGGFALSGDAAFSTSGEYNVAAGTITGTST
jgi:hypothetical protein